MTRLVSLTVAALLLSMPAFAQDAPQIRDVEIDSQSPEGQVLTAAGVAEDAEERIPILEGFVNDFPDSEFLGYALLQLQTQYIAQQDWANAAATGKRLLQMAPEDVEVRHNVNQALVQLQQWDELLPMLIETRPFAERDAAAPPPEDADEDEEIIHQNSVDYAAGVVDYLEWAMNVGVTQQTDPAQKIQWMDAMLEHYPQSEHAQGLEDQYVIAYQRMGDMAGMAAAIEKALEKNPGNEQYLQTLAEYALSQQDFDQAIARSEQLLKLMEEKPAPEGTAAEDWEASKAKFTAMGNYVTGNAHFQKGAWRTARSFLLKTVDAIKAEGGERYGLLSYMLGFCYVKLDIAGDNIAKATFWMKEAARIPNPTQAQAKQTLAAIEKAQ